MSLVAIDGSLLVPIGPGFLSPQSTPSNSFITLDATNEACIFIGHVVTSDEGSHTIDTSGSSKLEWATSAVTFANAGTTIKVGLAAVLTTVGPPARAVHVSDVITFDVSGTITGGGGITANAMQSHVPDTGSKTIAHGDLVAFAVQMTARGGVDSVTVLGSITQSSTQRPTCTSFTGAAYATQVILPNVVITFSDGAVGYFHASDILTATTTRLWSSGDATKEYGQLYKLPWPMKVYGLWGWVSPAADFDVILYSDPLGTPVASRTVSIDANIVSTSGGRKFAVLFSSPYAAGADQNIAAVFKPGALNISVYYKTIGAAGHRVADPWGGDGYGVSRASGAFANANASLDHYYIGLIAGAFEHGVQPSYALGI